MMVLVIALAMTSVYCASGQTFKATYTYDANGNRTLAKVIYLSSSPSNAAPNEIKEINLDSNNGLSVKIFPNPTKGNLNIQILGGDADFYSNSKNCIKVWNIQGTLLINKSPLGESNQVDLTSFNNGTFILNITINGKTTNYKILKN